MSGSTPGYRADIDGLRAVAVLAVLAHHLSVRIAPGGYVGVDVFFVISGYLITRIISRELADGSFSLAAFYQRRARRILPALGVVLAATLLIGWFVLAPSDYRNTAAASLSSIGFMSNVYFWRALSDGYFAGDAKLNPLLHTWSLGVEEQFYLVYPLLLLGLARYPRTRIVAVLGVLAAASLVAAEGMLGDKPVAVFFLSPFRAWELLAGALVACSPAVPAGRAAREAVAVLALAAIAFAVFALDPGSRFPGFSALLPVLGAAALIGVGGSGGSAVTSLLGARPVAYVGLISYSLYLWHWPLLVFARSLTSADLRPVVLPVVAVASIAIAAASYEFIEKPFRRRGPGTQARWLPVGGLAALALTAVAAIVLFASGGAAERIGPDARLADAVRTEPIRFRECERRLADPSSTLCTIGRAATAPRFAVWGDSHALAWLPGFDDALRDVGEAAIAAPSAGCPPLLGVENGSGVCHARNDRVFRTLKDDPRIETVVLAGFWSKYFADSNIALVAADGRTGNAEVAGAALRTTVQALRAAGKRVVLMGPVPTYPVDIPLEIARIDLGGTPPDTTTKTAVRAANAAFYSTATALSVEGVSFVDPAEWLCDPDCALVAGGNLLYRDSNHLSPRGAALFSSSIREHVLTTPFQPDARTPSGHRRSETADAPETVGGNG